MDLTHDLMNLVNDESVLLRMIPEQIKTITPDMKVLLNEHFKDIGFNCNECGGDVIPFNLTQGVCFHCKIEADLQNLEYEENDDAS